MAQGYDIRWLIRSDLPDVMRIERECFGKAAWDRDEMIAFLSQRKTIGSVIGRFNKPVGFMLYALGYNCLRLHSIAVDPEHRDQGLGRQLLERLESKMSQQRRVAVQALVSETNLDAQLFFAACGWRCRSIMRSGDETVDAYVFDVRVYDSMEAEAC